MISTYSWSFDPTPSNKDGIPMVWTTQAWSANVSGHPLRAPFLHVGIKTNHSATAVSTGLIRQETE